MTANTMGRFIVPNGNAKFRHRFRSLIVAISIITSSACGQLGYYGQAVRGHFDIMGKSRPITEILNDPKADTKLKQRLLLARKIRAFAVSDLDLPDNGSYDKYADIGRNSVNWAVVAAPEFSVEPKRWCFAVVGCLSYRGYFDKAKAEKEAAELKKQGLDVEVAGSTAYSTLGWFNDPLVNTMINRPEGLLAEVIFHELTHQKLYISGDTAFNEALAVAVSRHGVAKWFERSDNRKALDDYRALTQRRTAFRRLMLDTRAKLSQLYASKIDRDEMRKKKKAIFDEMRRRYRELKRSWNGYTGFDAWMSQDLNNAHLSLIATYHKLVPPLLSSIKQCNYDMPLFFRQVEKWKKLDAEKRISLLRKGNCS